MFEKWEYSQEFRKYEDGTYVVIILFLVSDAILRAVYMFPEVFTHMWHAVPINKTKPFSWWWQKMQMTKHAKKISVREKWVINKVIITFFILLSGVDNIKFDGSIFTEKDSVDMKQ